MEKIMITQNQAGAIEKRLTVFKETIENIIDYQYYMHSEENTDELKYCDDCKCLNEIKPYDMARALISGYEVEQPKFKVGEWATRVGTLVSEMEFFDGKTPFKVSKVYSITVEDKNGRNHALEYIRHATKEEIFWAELGRNFRQFRWDDCLVLRNGETFRVLSDRCEVYAENHFEKSNVLSFYPADSRVKFPK